jgi:hypothetical protein
VLADPVGGVLVDVSGEDTEAVFRCLYAEHGPPLLRLATTLTGGDRGRAKDLVQETMLRAWTHRDNLDRIALAAMAPPLHRHHPGSDGRETATAQPLVPIGIR